MRPRSTGRFQTRAELVREVWWRWSGTKSNITEIAIACRVSDSVVRKILDTKEGYMPMKKVKVSDLIGPALDWAVGKCEDSALEQPELAALRLRVSYGDYRPSSNPAHAWPIIERGVIGTWSSTGGVDWHARGGLAFQEVFDGPTPLIAAMRCYVASKLGETVEVPEGLLS